MDAEMGNVLELRDVKKTYKPGFIPKPKEVLKGVSFSVAEGEIFGQPHLEPRAKERLGFLPENPYFYDYLTAWEFLDFYAQLFRVEKSERAGRIDRLIKTVDLERAAGLPLRKYSRGMLQRIGLAQALINEPTFVILDEPLGGLDPLGRKEIRDIILGLRDAGKTVLFTSHILQDIEMICDHVAIIVKGRILNQGRLSELVSEKILFTEITVSGIAEEDLRSFGDCVSVRDGRALLKVPIEDDVPKVLDLVRERGGRIYSLVPRTQTLEDIFVDTVAKQ